MTPFSTFEQAAIEWFRDLTATRKDFSVPELASPAAPEASLRKSQEGTRPLTIGRVLAMLRVALRQDEDAAVAALNRLLAIASPRLVACAMPAAQQSLDLRRQTDEVLLDAADMERWKVEAYADGAVSPEELADGRNRAQHLAQELAALEAGLDQVRSPQLALIAGGAR